MKKELRFFLLKFYYSGPEICYYILRSRYVTGVKTIIHWYQVVNVGIIPNIAGAIFNEKNSEEDVGYDGKELGTWREFMVVYVQIEQYQCHLDKKMQ